MGNIFANDHLKFIPKKSFSFFVEYENGRGDESCMSHAGPKLFAQCRSTRVVRKSKRKMDNAG